MLSKSSRTSNSLHDEYMVYSDISSPDSGRQKDVEVMESAFIQWLRRRYPVGGWNTADEEPLKIEQSPTTEHHEI